MLAFGCGGGGADNPDGISHNCPKPLGPDFDFGSSMILRTLPDGQRVLVAAQKSGMVWAHDPDENGKLLWKVQLVDKLALGMITFGGRQTTRTPTSDCGVAESRQ